QQLCPPGNSRFGLPSEELGRQKKREARPDGKGKDFYITAPSCGGVHDGLLKAIDEVGSWKKQSKALNDARQKTQRKGGARKKDKREPEELVQHLGFLHRIGHAGHNQSERAKRNDADGDEPENRNGTTDTRYVKNGSSQEQFHYTQGQG